MSESNTTLTEDQRASMLAALAEKAKTETNSLLPEQAATTEQSARSQVPLSDFEYKTALNEIADLLRKGWKDDALRYVEGVLSRSELLGIVMQPSPQIASFEQSFKTACRKHGMIAAYVIVDKYLDKASNTEKFKFYVGGHHTADAVVSTKLSPFQSNNPGGPNGESFYEISDLEKRKPMDFTVAKKTP